MKPHTTFLDLAAAAIDFPLAPADRHRLEEHLRGCDACWTTATAMRRDAAQFASIPVMPLSDRREATLLRAVLRPRGAHTPMRMVAIAALLGLLVVGTLIAGAQLVRRPDDNLSVVIPTPTATASPTSVVDDPTSEPSPASSPTARPTSSPPPSRAPATAKVVVPTVAPDRDSVPIPSDSIAVVVTNDLRVRSKPEVSDTSERLSPLLQDGQQVFVVDGPVSGSGFEWYLVSPLGRYASNDLPFGWIAAAGKDGEAWLAGADVTCPDPPTTFASFIAATPTFAEMEPPLALACRYESISFPARIIRPEATCGADPGWGIEPTWLGNVCTSPEFVFLDPSGSMEEHRDAVIDPAVDTSSFDPGVDPATGTDVVLTGQWDHPAARDCTVVVYEPDAGVPAISAEEAVLGCRSQFVITHIAAAEG